jgi:hypothetical protein
MPAHYTYVTPDPTTLNQGDVLERTPELLGIIGASHPHYAAHPSHKYFMVLTQSCELVRRGAAPCAADYINLGAVMPVVDAIRREAAKYQEADWQKQKAVISSKDRDKLVLFIQRLLDNNEPGLFYLHEDVSVKIHLQCCAFLSLSIPLPAQHYDAGLRAKVAQLHDTFQAKLGSLIGSMYSRVGTVEWDSHYATNPTIKEANSLLKKTLRIIPEDKLREGIADLQREPGGLAGKTADDIFDYIVRKKVLPRSKRFEQRAVTALRETVKPMNQIRGRVETALKKDDALKAEIAALLTAAGVADAAGVTAQVLQKILQRLGILLSDEGLPDGEKAMQKIILGLLQDPQISKIMQ